MSAIDLRTEIMEMINEESDTSISEAIRTLLFKLRQTEEADDDLTDDDIAELDRRRALRLSGQSKGYTAEESIHMLRAGPQE